MSYQSAAAEDFLRRAIISATHDKTRPGLVLVRGACKTYDGCTDLSRPVKGSRRICVLCAGLQAEDLPKSQPTDEFTLEEMLAVALDVEPLWVISMLRGFDGDPYGQVVVDHEAYHVGKRLWNKFVPKEDTDV